MSFTGFSEEDLERMKCAETGAKSGLYIRNPNIKKINKLGANTKVMKQYRSPVLQTHNSDEAIDSIRFDKCKLSLKSPTTPPPVDMENISATEYIENTNETQCNFNEVEANVLSGNDPPVNTDANTEDNITYDRKNSLGTPDVMKCLDNYTEDDLVTYKVKLEDIQLKQKLMEEQNKKRKEMLAKALADRTKKTEEEVNRLEKIKKELQVIDGQFSVDVSILRKKIDQACLTYSEAEKHYLKIEKDFLQAKINLQKEKEKKELLTEHLCALITHNETRKAQKLETLMLELASDMKNGITDPVTPVDETSIVIDGVDERTGKMVEISPDS